MVKDKKLLRFIVVCIAFYFGWFVIYDLLLKPLKFVDFYLTHFVTEHTILGLKLLGYNLSHGIANNGNHIVQEGVRKVLMISNACNGLVLYPLFIGFIVAIPGRLIDMVKVIAAGCLIIYLVNVLRAICLCLIKINAPAYLDFNHRYTFLILVYGVIFLIWIFWIKRYSTLKEDFA